MSRPFVDQVEVTAKGGDGGDGCTSFDRGPYTPHGGPDGGNGGDGGDVILKATSKINTLSYFNYKESLEAEAGENGGPNNQQGATGDDLIKKVPPGTVVHHLETNRKLGELTESGQTLTAARGGEGGRGNHCFSNSQRQHPRFHEFGKKGEKVPLKIELKLIADVGLVGLPNAGKSTLLNGLTNAHPEIASHPFTTTNPNLGVLEKDYKRLVLCDIPGLIENAHQGAGLGLEFLRHVDRTSILLYMIDIAAPTPVDDYRALRNELSKYDPTLLDKPTIILCNKIDLVEEEQVEIFAEDITPPPGPVIGISATEKYNFNELIEALWKFKEEKVTQPEEEDISEPEKVVKMEQEEPIKVYRTEDRFLLKGDKVKNLLNRFDLRNPDALSYVRERLLSIGLHKKLEKAGCRPGDTVQIGRQEFEYTG